MQWHEILGVEKDSDGETIKSAYRKLAKIYHPDLMRDKSKIEQAASEEIMKKINMAYLEAFKYDKFIPDDEFMREITLIKQIMEIDINNKYKNNEELIREELNKLDCLFDRIIKSHIENIKMEERICQQFEDATERICQRLDNIGKKLDNMDENLKGNREKNNFFRKLIKKV